MCIVLVDGAVSGPACVAEPRRRVRAVRSGGALQVREVADRADVVEPLGFEERDPRRVVAAELEPLEAGDQQILGRTAADVSDDPAHRPTPFRSPKRRKARLDAIPPSDGSAELLLDERRKASTGLLRHLA